MKHCKSCGVTKDLSLFYKRSRSSDGYNPHCKECVASYEKAYRTPDVNKRYNLKKSFGLSVEDYTAMLESQGGVCAICKQPETTIRAGKVQALAVDHCHTTGKIRGLLCNSCNRALGKFKDDVSIVKSAVAYLEEHA